MIPPAPAASAGDLSSLHPPGPPELFWLDEAGLILLAVSALFATAFFSLLSAALRAAVPARVLGGVADERRRTALQPLLARSEALATSASLLRTLAQVLFVVAAALLLWGRVHGTTGAVLLVLLGVPVLVVATEVPANLLPGSRSDALLPGLLPGVRWMLEPFTAVEGVLASLRRGALYVLRLPPPAPFASRIAQDLRIVLEDADLEEELDPTERELIENVVEFHDVDVGEVMTPRTELRAVEMGAGLEEVARTIAETGHTRIPVYRGNLDTIVGVVYAQKIVELLGQDALASTRMERAVVPVTFVPETKRVSELLTEFRRDRRKIAVVLDEYGGTAGIVTLGDLVEELVGEIREELGEASPAPVRPLDEGQFEVQAGTRISEVNEALDLDLPEEEDYETLAGFVLSELGHFPKRGEAFEHGGARYTVIEANDRRVFVVRVRLHRLASRTG